MSTLILTIKPEIVSDLVAFEEKCHGNLLVALIKR